MTKSLAGFGEGRSNPRRRFNDGVRRSSGETYRKMLMRMAMERGVATPTIDDLIRLDRRRKGKKLSNEDWTSKIDPDAKTRMKDGSTHLAYKPEHVVDLDRALERTTSGPPVAGVFGWEQSDDADQEAVTTGKTISKQRVPGEPGGKDI
jgi:hypothetical protein